MSALVIFSVDVQRLVTFYEAVLGATPTYEPSGDVRLVGEREEVLVHGVPAKIAKTIEIQTPPQPREQSAIKPVFDVASLEAALAHVAERGGVATGRTFSVDGLTRHDVLDPDGNVIQLRGRTP
jgi:predicted enzyme related to lactoylglutathione lyase